MRAKEIDVNWVNNRKMTQLDLAEYYLDMNGKDGTLEWLANEEEKLKKDDMRKDDIS